MGDLGKRSEACKATGVKLQPRYRISTSKNSTATYARHLLAYPSPSGCAGTGPRRL